MQNTALSTTIAWVFTWLEAGTSMGMVTDSSVLFVTDLSVMFVTDLRGLVRQSSLYSKQ